VITLSRAATCVAAVAGLSTISATPAAGEQVIRPRQEKAGLPVPAALSENDFDSEVSGCTSFRMSWHLQNEGHGVNPKRIRRLMRIMRLKPIYQTPHRPWGQPRAVVYFNTVECDHQAQAVA
jgi:hypothetical protein